MFEFLRYKGKRRIALMFFLGSLFFATGLVIFPEFKFEVWENNMQSPFTLMGIILFLTGGFLGIQVKKGKRK